MEKDNCVMANCVLGRDIGPKIETKCMELQVDEALLGNILHLDGYEWEILFIDTFYPIDNTINI